MAHDEISAVVRRLGGVATRAQLLVLVSREDLAAAVTAGALTQTVRGRFSTHDAARDLVTAHRVGGVLSGLSAAQHWEWPVKRAPAKPVVTVPRNRSLTDDDLDVHRRDLPALAIVEGAVLTRAATVVDCARTLPFDEALAVADSALREGRVTRQEILKAAQASPRSGRVRALRVAERADAEADNPFESCVRAIALDVPSLVVQTQVQVGDIGRVDLADRHQMIAIECESWAYHSGEEPFRRDIRRYTHLVCAGWLVVRFVWEDAMARPDRIRRALEGVVRVRLDQNAWPARGAG